MSVLIVDDYESFRDMLAITLQEAGYSDVLTADSAIVAFEMLGIDDPNSDVSQIDLILMDINMPEIDGVEACSRLKEHPRLKDIPIIMITGYADISRLESALAAGATDYITKPPNNQEMLARVGSAIEAKRDLDRRKSAYFNDLEEKSQKLELAFTELGKKNEQLEQASLAKTQILSTATHELKTPLTSIVGYVDRLLLQQESLGQLNDRQQRYLETVQKNAHRLKSLVDDLLDMSRIEAGNLELKISHLNVKQEIEDALQLIQTQIQEKQIKVTSDIPPGLSDIKADRLRFGQVVGNLLSNACKYSDPGTEVCVAAHQDEDDSVRIEVRDIGVGISPEDQTKLFTKFFRADNSSTREASGTGLGLYITKYLIEAHGGNIWVVSELGKGTTVSCTWPGSDSGEAEGAVNKEMAINL